MYCTTVYSLPFRISKSTTAKTKQKQNSIDITCVTRSNGLSWSGASPYCIFFCFWQIPICFSLLSTYFFFFFVLFPTQFFWMFNGLFPWQLIPGVCALRWFLPDSFRSEIVCRWLKFGQKVLSIINYTDKTMTTFVCLFVLSFFLCVCVCGLVCVVCNGNSGWTKGPDVSENRFLGNHLSYS